MNKYKQLIMTKPCDFCSTLSQSEAYARAYRRVANDAIDYLLRLYHAQQGNQLAEVDCERVAELLDALLSIENEDANGTKL